MKKLLVFTIDDISDFINEVNRKDKSFLLQFAGAGYTYPLTSDQLKINLEDRSFRLFKFTNTSDNTTLGYCQLTRIDLEKKKASIGRVLICDEFRGKGYSLLMIEQLLSYAKTLLGPGKLSLRVFDFNKPALQCYLKLGFQEVFREEKYFEIIDESWNCITMERQLS
jgi:RimJ/RimL family protein N-acetyltransferase